MVKPILQAMRIEQWVKNLFLFIPIFFAGELFDFQKLTTLGLGFLSFCFISSGIYIINDYQDLDEDRQHYEKRNRPLASGAISKRMGLMLMFSSLTIGVLLSLLLPLEFTWVVLIYGLLNVAYSFGLKKVSILDLIMVSFGFILRIIAGGIASEVYVTNWLIVMVFLLSLFIVVAKRRDDILEFMDSGKVLRASSQQYNLQFINSILTMISGIIIVAYIMYTISPVVAERLDTEYLYITSLFVTAGLMRYLQITLVENNSGSPVKLLYRDKFIQITIALWLLSFFLILYAFKV